MLFNLCDKLNSQTTFDYIIVGQGLAGSCLALQLLKNERKVLVIDKGDPQRATHVAAGLFNPITGKKMTGTWMADVLFPYLHQFYQEAEQRTGSSFFSSLPLYRPFISIEEQNEWMGKSVESTLAQYIEQVYTTPFEPTHVKNNFGGLLLKQCGYLNTVKFSHAVRNYLRSQATLLEEDFLEPELEIQGDVVSYKGFHAKKIIFCQGESVHASKLFSWLPIRPLKGETLTIQTSENISTIYNRGVYLVPGIWKVGATYAFHDTSRTVTSEGRNELVEKLHDLINFPYTIINQAWGMRPTTPDRRPILGPHPEYPAVVIFNGLGTKGVSLAPHFSNVLANWLENNGPINKEVDIHRYKHYNYGGNLLR